MERTCSSDGASFIFRRQVGSEDALTVPWCVLRQKRETKVGESPYIRCQMKVRWIRFSCQMSAMIQIFHSDRSLQSLLM